MMALCDGDAPRAAGLGRGPQGGRRRRRRAQHRRHGDRSPSPLVDDALRAADRSRRMFVPTVRALADGGPAVPRPALRRAHADARSRPDGDRVELPLRRSRDAGGADALGRTICCPGWRAPRDGRDAGGRAALRARASRSAWCWPPRGYPGKPRAGRRHRRAAADGTRRPGRVPRRHAPRRRRAAGHRRRARAGRDARTAPTSTAARARAYGAIEADPLRGYALPPRHRPARETAT